MTYNRLVCGIAFILSGVWVALVACALPVRAQENCYSDWSESVAVIKARDLLSIEVLSRRVKSELNATLVKTTLCEANDSYVYVVIVRLDGGKMETVRIDAHNANAKLARVK